VCAYIDALEGGTPKQALTLCDKLLKKHDDAALVHALRAVALDRLGKREESMAACARVRALRPSDPAVLRALAVVYENQGQGTSQTHTYIHTCTHTYTYIHTHIGAGWRRVGYSSGHCGL
jgi:predicted Zn-dependent protease